MRNQIRAQQEKYEYIVIDAGGSKQTGEEVVTRFANDLPTTVDASYLKSFAKKQGMSVSEE